MSISSAIMSPSFTMPRINNHYGELEDCGDSVSVSTADLLLVDGKGESSGENDRETSSRIKALHRHGHKALHRHGHCEAEDGCRIPLSSPGTASKVLSPAQSTLIGTCMHRNRSESRSKSPSCHRSRRKPRKVAEDSDGKASARHAPFAQLDISTANEKEIVIGWVRNGSTSQSLSPLKPASRPLTSKPTKGGVRQNQQA